MNLVIFCIRSLRDKLHIAQNCLQWKSRKLPGRQAKPGTGVQKVPFALQELAAWAEQIKCQERVMFLFLSLSVWCWRFMDPFILLISVRLRAINIRTSTNCLQDLNLRLNVGFIWSHGREALLQLHTVFVCLHLNTLKCSLLAIQILLITWWVPKLLLLLEDEGINPVLGRAHFQCSSARSNSTDPLPVVVMLLSLTKLILNSLSNCEKLNVYVQLQEHVILTDYAEMYNMTMTVLQCSQLFIHENEITVWLI